MVVGRSAEQLHGWIDGHRDLIGRFAFELVIIFVGVTAAFALENAREARAETQYRVQMVDALRTSLDDWAAHGTEIERQIDALLREFNLARQRFPFIAKVAENDRRPVPGTGLWRLARLALWTQSYSFAWPASTVEPTASATAISATTTSAKSVCCPTPVSLARSTTNRVS